ncbi:uncharacterized protein LOC107054177 isoform X1 [Gallus gallus]|uniref:uncharacterized protein LOC107054177 isoform X1 n=1 Tax=Gallus gallus TaxID=9031 RepID=UPI001EFFAAF7|nr:uncharacterized protein LOC107054177 isoform X1 [Gallus gallus]
MYESPEQQDRYSECEIRVSHCYVPDRIIAERERYQERIAMYWRSPNCLMGCRLISVPQVHLLIYNHSQHFQKRMPKSVMVSGCMEHTVQRKAFLLPSFFSTLLTTVDKKMKTR